MTPQEFVHYFGSTEVANRARPEGTDVPGALLEATVDGTDRSAWTAEQQANADKALNKIVDALYHARAKVFNDIPAADEATKAEAHRWIGLLARFALYDDARPPHIKDDAVAYEAWKKDRRRTTMAVGRLMRC